MTKKLTKYDFADIALSTLLSVIFSVLAVMVFAVIVGFAEIPDEVIEPVNIAIKILAIALASVIGMRRKSNGLIKGLITGLLYAGATYLVFALTSGSFTDNAMTVYDALTCAASGVLSGILAVNIGKDRASAD